MITVAITIIAIAIAGGAGFVSGWGRGWKECSEAHDGLRKDHEQFFDWATPQLERLGHEMKDNAELRAKLNFENREPPHCPTCDCGQHQPQSGDS